MFKRPRELLQVQLDARQRAHLTEQAIPARQPVWETLQSGPWPAPLLPCGLQWRSHHTEAVHHCQTHGKAFAVCLLVFNPYYRWANLVVVPVQVVLLAPFIALGKLSVMVGLSAWWVLGSASREKNESIE